MLRLIRNNLFVVHLYEQKGCLLQNNRKHWQDEAVGDTTDMEQVT